MKNSLSSLGGWLCGMAVAAALLIGGVLWAGDRQLFGIRSQNGENTRACVMQSASTAIACTASLSASSNALHANSRYLIQCADDSYVLAGTTAPTATANNYTFVSPKWAIVDMASDDSAFYVACLNANSSVGCRVWECL